MKKHDCPIEFSDVFNNNIRAKWEQSEENEVVISKPPCVGDNQKIITRLCVDGEWKPLMTPKCDRISTNNGLCPDFFTYIQEKCVYTTEPLVSTKNYQVLTKIQYVEQDEKSNFWLPLRRRVPFGPFEYNDIGHNYGESINVNFTDYRKFLSSDCLLYNVEKEKLQFENCNKTHHFIKQFETSFTTYNCPKNCKACGFWTNKCYCKRKSCEKYATIENVYEMKILQTLAGNEICQIGENSGFRSFITGNSWQYGSFNTNCSLCEVNPLQHEEVKMYLSFDEKKKKMFLLVYSPENILKYDENQKAIYCFTNAANRPKKKVEYKEIFEYFESNFSFNAYVLRLEKYPGIYWCEAFRLNMSEITSNQIIAYQNESGNEYSLRVIIRNVCENYGCDKTNFYEKIINDKLVNIFQQFNGVLRIMEIVDLDIDLDRLDIILHLTTLKENYVVQEYEQCVKKFRNLDPDISVKHFRSSDFCLPETTKWKNYSKLNWPLSKIGLNATPEEFCLRNDGTPVTRFCQGDFIYGAYWAGVEEYCVQNTEISYLTTLLKNMTSVNNENLEQIQEITKNTSFSILDIYYLSKTLHKLNHTSYFDTNFYIFDILNQLLSDSNEAALKESQNLLNLTDEILELVDGILSDFRYDSSSVLLIQKQNLLVHITSPFFSNISGFALYRNGTVENFYRNGTFQEIQTHDLLLALYAPEIILEQVLNETLNKSDIFIISLVYFKSTFFVSNDFKPVSYTVSIIIPNFGNYLETPIPILFRSNQTLKGEKCAFWDYGKGNNRKKGAWSFLGGTYLGVLKESDLHMCGFVHLTHFALLVMSDIKNMADEGADFLTPLLTDDYNEFVLNMITIIGGAISVLGIFGIFLTALIQKQWRSKIGTKILLNLSIAILLENICIHLSEIEVFKQSELNCKMIGMILHYIVLSKFSWMLIYALLQYLRFVKVFGSVPSNLILKSVFIGWGVPLVLVLISGLTTTESYVSSSYEFCYPRGMYLFIFVLLPICLIVVCNLTLFCIIMYQVTRSKTQSFGSYKSFKLQLYLAVLLFFVLGIPWLFGILAEITHHSTLKIALFYLFCITGTLQGFVLFLFYVVLNTETREGWIRFYKNHNQR